MSDHIYFCYDGFRYPMKKVPGETVGEFQRRCMGYLHLKRKGLHLHSTFMGEPLDPDMLLEEIPDTAIIPALEQYTLGERERPFYLGKRVVLKKVTHYRSLDDFIASKFRSTFSYLFGS